uniref:Homeotic protein proboscipedia n=1 Tax=Rhabditophanes sp. KR3021 TaxID=114890 RepID=A0AC35TR98_9BILA
MVAAYFQLDHNIDQSGSSVIVTKNEKSQKPQAPFETLIEHHSFADDKTFRTRKNTNNSLSSNQNVTSPIECNNRPNSYYAVPSPRSFDLNSYPGSPPPFHPANNYYWSGHQQSFYIDEGANELNDSTSPVAHEEQSDYYNSGTGFTQYPSRYQQNVYNDQGTSPMMYQLTNQMQNGLNLGKDGVVNGGRQSSNYENGHHPHINPNMANYMNQSNYSNGYVQNMDQYYTPQQMQMIQSQQQQQQMYHQQQMNQMMYYNGAQYNPYYQSYASSPQGMVMMGYNPYQQHHQQHHQQHNIYASDTMAPSTSETHDQIEPQNEEKSPDVEEEKVSKSNGGSPTEPKDLSSTKKE